MFGLHRGCWAGLEEEMCAALYNSYNKKIHWKELNWVSYEHFLSLYVYILNFVFCLQHSKMIKGGRAGSQSDRRLNTDFVYKITSQCFFLLQDFLQLQHWVNCTTIKGERTSTNTGKHFSQYIQILNPGPTTILKSFFTTRYLFPATHLSRNARQFFIPSGFLQKS